MKRGARVTRALELLAHHVLPEMAGGFVGYWLHAVRHTVFESGLKRFGGRGRRHS